MSIANLPLPAAATRLVAIASDPRPRRELLGAVRAGFILQGTSFQKWCRAHAIEPARARLVLVTDADGPKTNALRERLIANAGLLPERQ